MKSYLYNVITDKEKGPLVFALQFFLYVLSFVYVFLLRLQAIAYEYKLLRSNSVPATVISVGNITWGGTGKTSMVMLLIEFLLSKGKKIAVLSRGYKSDAGRNSADSGLKYKAMGDEPYLIAEKYPQVHVLVGRNRVLNGLKAVKELKCDTIILDDAFQHRGITRDLDVVLVDVLNPFGNGYLLPRGILREPVLGLGRADVIVLTNCEFDREKQKKVWFDINWINDRALILYTSYRFKSLYDIQSRQVFERFCLAQKPVCILASIGNFLSFKLSVRDFLKSDIRLEFDFPDHHEYTKIDLENILNSCCNKGIETIITTEKDAVRLRPLLSLNPPEVRIVVCEVRVEIIENKDKFFERLLDAYTN